MPTPSTPLQPLVLEARDLVKNYGGSRAVDGLSFVLRRGECFGLLGPNGAGKTTTIRLLYGFTPPDAGSLRLFGLDALARRRSVKSRLGVCHQGNTLDPDLSVRENMLVFASYFDLPRREAGERADRLLSFAALEGRRDDPIPSLSGGMQRRLMLARALVNDPEILILDEPTTGLDPQSRHQVWEKLEQLRARGLSILLTTHYMEEASRLCDRLLIMDRGRVLVEGSPRDLVAAHAGRNVLEIPEPEEEVRRFVRERDLAMDDLGHRLIVYLGDGEELFREITARFCRDSCILRMATLEDVFLRLTGRDLRE
jgi:lipooligosaccharide transport system ATP-binding protein